MGIGTLRRHYDDAPEGPEESSGGELDASAFASEAALEVAQAAELTASDFEGVEPAGKTGYTAGQVREMAG